MLRQKDDRVRGRHYNEADRNCVPGTNFTWGGLWHGCRPRPFGNQLHGEPRVTGCDLAIYDLVLPIYLQMAGLRSSGNDAHLCHPNFDQGRDEQITGRCFSRLGLRFLRQAPSPRVKRQTRNSAPSNPFYAAQRAAISGAAVRQDQGFGLPAGHRSGHGAGARRGAGDRGQSRSLRRFENTLVAMREDRAAPAARRATCSASVVQANSDPELLKIRARDCAEARGALRRQFI